MRVALISDVGGHVERLRSALGLIDAVGADHLVVLGDLVGPGLASARVIERLAERPATTIVAGPLDRWAVGRHEDRPARRFEDHLRLDRRTLSVEALAWLDALPSRSVLELDRWRLELGPLPNAIDSEGATLSLSVPSGPGTLAVAAGCAAGWLPTGEGLTLIVPSLSMSGLDDPRTQFLWLDLPESGVPTAQRASAAFSFRREVARFNRLVKAGELDRRALTVHARTHLGRARSRVRPLDASDSAQPLLVHFGRAVYRPMIGRWPTDDVPVVHEVRVATRRLHEVLQLFSSFEPGPKAGKLIARLRALRRRLAPRRAIDVQLLCLGEQQAHAQVGPLERIALVSTLEKLRARATRPLTDGESRSKYARHGLDLLEFSMHVADLPWRSLLPQLLERRQAECHGLLPALDREADAPAHHELRKAMKRLRYACELAEAALGAGSAASLLTAFRPLQDAFGRYNDMHEMRALMDLRAVAGALEPDSLARLSKHFDEARHAGFEAARAALRASFPDLLREVGRLASSLPTD